MKKLLIVAILLLAKNSFGADCGYWVTESNRSLGKFTIVRFYKLDGTMVHEKQVDGILDITRNGVKKRLNKKLAQLVFCNA
jgi:hypothetical protein